MPIEKYITKREILLEEVARAASDLLDHACNYVMPPWWGQDEKSAEIMMRLVRALSAVDDDSFEKFKLLTKYMKEG